MTMTSLKTRCLIGLVGWLAGLVASTSALAQFSGVDPNDPVVVMIKNIQAGELVPFKDFCAGKYPQLRNALDAQLKTKLQALYGADYLAKVSKVIASRQYKEQLSNSLSAFNAWPANVQLSRCEMLETSEMGLTPEIVEQLRQGLEQQLATLTSVAQTCSALYPGEKHAQLLVEEQIQDTYGEGPQAQRKYAAFLAKPETKALLADSHAEFEKRRGKADHEWIPKCFSAERRASGLLLPTKVPAPVPDKPTSAPATQALAVAQKGATTCLDFASNGTGPGSSKYIAHNGASLGRLANITRIEGVVRGKTGYEPEKPISLTFNSVSNWRDSGYVGRGPTGGWKTWASSSDANPVNLIDIRFGVADGIYPSKTSVPAGTQSLYLVQRNTQDRHALKTFDSFTLSICGASN